MKLKRKDITKGMSSSSNRVNQRNALNKDTSPLACSSRYHHSICLYSFFMPLRRAAMASGCMLHSAKPTLASSALRSKSLAGNAILSLVSPYHRRLRLSLCICIYLVLESSVRTASSFNSPVALHQFPQDTCLCGFFFFFLSLYNSQIQLLVNQIISQTLMVVDF